MQLPYSNPWRNSFISRVLRTMFYTTKTLTYSKPTVDTLYRKISQAGDPRESISTLLDQWVEKGGGVKQSTLQQFIKRLRKHRRYVHALQISEWMSSERNHDISPPDIAIRLDLISKVHGLKEAEKYFDSIPHSLRINKVYGALLKCYADHKSVEEAEAIMEKMREEGFLQTSLPYNVMLTLYSQLGMHEKLDSVMQEMEERGISYDKFTYNIRMSAYAATSDVAKMEKLLMIMEANPEICIDWHAYYVVANGYLKAGLFEKSKAILRKAEQIIRISEKQLAYECLITLYATMGSKDEVYRIWNLYKNMGLRFNSGYLCMISSLMKLDDIDGAERIMEEWESVHVVFDIRIPNMMINFYCNKGFLDKAEACNSKLVETVKGPQASTLSRLASGYHVKAEMDKAVETMKKAILLSQPRWKPTRDTYAACLEHLKKKGDLVEAEELLRLTREHGLSVHDKFVE